MKKGFSIISTLGLAAALVASASAAPVTYSYLRTIDMAPHPTFSRMTTAVATSSGSIYFTDNGSDHIGFISDPLTAVGGTAAVGDVEDVGISGSGFSSGNSFRGITSDGTTIFAGGWDGGTASQLVQVTGSSPTWTLTPITLPTGDFSGFSAVGTNKLAAATLSTGAMNILTVSGATASLDGTVAGGTARINNVQADIAHSRIYESQCLDSLAGGVQVFTSNGTFAGTSYSGAANPIEATIASSWLLSNTALNYQSVTVNSADNLLCVSRNLGTSGQSGWALIDASVAGTNLASYAFIDGSTTPDGALTSAQYCVASAFFTKAGVKYLALGKNDGKIYIFQDHSAVNSWEVFE